ncbi:hypothetical protein BCL76_113178 [Streptomyces sp. CG 926]|uniref:Rv1733c family protein n=1 Tax=Streptomyces sp. CG 926 TaxID=1882405 RepID=UPI000D6A7F42|nr:hypothetical protein [Streptomyces sp. CG 926]PWK65191.1 hypothetical protein BCL76_113178 [Streptomyces sp. CG 926]
MNGATGGPEGNPLRRRADRTRTFLRAAYAIACVIAVVFAVAVGRTVWADGSREADTIARHRHAVTATTVGATAYRAGDRQGQRTITVAPATWHYPAHRAHTDAVPVPAQTRKGDDVRLWVDDQGNAATAPLGAADIALEAFAFGTTVLTAILLVSSALVRVGLRIVDARSARAWEAEWADVEPVWTGRLRPGQGADDG